MSWRAAPHKPHERRRDPRVRGGFRRPVRGGRAPATTRTKSGRTIEPVRRSAPAPSRSRWRLGALALLLAALAAVAVFAPDLRELEIPLRELGAWTWLASLILMLVAAATPLPAHVAAATNGLIHGPVLGLALSWSGAVVGSWLAYRFGDALAPDEGPDGSVRPPCRIRARVGRGSAATLLAVRLVPGLPLFAVNYALGGLRIPPLRFLVTTALGILPATLACVLAGDWLLR